MLSLGKSLNREYNLRVPFLDGFYNIGLFFNTKSTFLLFSVDSDFSQSSNKEIKDSSRVNMFKNIESSRFAETFLNLHNYRGTSLDILNQFKEIKPDFSDDVMIVLNETHILNKITVESNTYFDQLLLYMFTLSSYPNEFLYLIAERQNVSQKVKKKIVRTTSLQIATTRALSLMEEYYSELKKSEKMYENINVPIIGEIEIETNTKSDLSEEID